MKPTRIAGWLGVAWAILAFARPGAASPGERSHDMTGTTTNPSAGPATIVLFRNGALRVGAALQGDPARAVIFTFAQQPFNRTWQLTQLHLRSNAGPLTASVLDANDARPCFTSVSDNFGPYAVKQADRGSAWTGGAHLTTRSPLAATVVSRDDARHTLTVNDAGRFPEEAGGALETFESPVSRKTLARLNYLGRHGNVLQCDPAADASFHSVTPGQAVRLERLTSDPSRARLEAWADGTPLREGAGPLGCDAVRLRFEHVLLDPETIDYATGAGRDLLRETYDVEVAGSQMTVRARTEVLAPVTITAYYGLQLLAFSALPGFVGMDAIYYARGERTLVPYTGASESGALARFGAVDKAILHQRDTSLCLAFWLDLDSDLPARGLVPPSCSRIIKPSKLYFNQIRTPTEFQPGDTFSWQGGYALFANRATGAAFAYRTRDGGRERLHLEFTGPGTAPLDIPAADLDVVCQDDTITVSREPGAAARVTASGPGAITLRVNTGASH